MLFLIICNTYFLFPSLLSMYSHLYYIDGQFIYRMDTNGRNSMQKVVAQGNIFDVAVDSSLNRLYWTANRQIWFINLTLANPPHKTIDTGSSPDSVPYGLSASGGTLYWTIPFNNMTSSQGAIYMFDVRGDDNSSPTPLIQGDDIDPRDVTTSSEPSVPVSFSVFLFFLFFFLYLFSFLFFCFFSFSFSFFPLSLSLCMFCLLFAIFCFTNNNFISQLLKFCVTVKF